MIVPTSTGHVFVSDENSMRNDNPPIQKLEDDHIFVPFVKEFWHKITTPGAGDLLMNAYAMLLFGIDTVPDACQQYIGTQLRQTPPDIVLIKDLNPLLHGFHQRTPNVWPYISIDKALVDRWADCMGRCPNERQTLALEALLKMILVHEGGHWHYTLARRPSYLIWNESSQPFSMQRVGSYTNEMMHLRNGLPAEQQEEIVNKCIPKSISVPWNPNKGESGNFSEYKGLGGMMGFDSRSETIFMRTSAGPFHLLSTDYLIAFRERGICQFHPEKTADLPQPLPKATSIRGKVQTHLQSPTDLPFWPDTNDVCSVAPSDGLPEFVGLGFNMTIPDCMNLEELFEYRARKHGLSNNASFPAIPR